VSHLARAGQLSAQEMAVGEGGIYFHPDFIPTKVYHRMKSKAFFSCLVSADRRHPGTTVGVRDPQLGEVGQDEPPLKEGSALSCLF